MSGRGSPPYKATLIGADGVERAIEREIPVEAPIAVEFNGIGYAVMMATPFDLEDFATGFALAERIVEHASEIEAIDSCQTGLGWLLKIALYENGSNPYSNRSVCAYRRAVADWKISSRSTGRYPGCSIVRLFLTKRSFARLAR